MENQYVPVPCGWPARASRHLFKRGPRIGAGRLSTACRRDASRPTCDCATGGRRQCTLAAFALAARDQSKSRGADVLTPQQLAYSGCRLRQEGGPWYYGSTYIVTLTPDGRVYLHAKNMSLSAGKLQSPIYAQILRALGTPLAVLQGLSSSDPAARTRAQVMLLAHLESEPHGPFNLTGGLRSRGRLRLGQYGEPARAARGIRSQCIAPGCGGHRLRRSGHQSQ